MRVPELLLSVLLLASCSHGAPTSAPPTPAPSTTPAATQVSPRPSSSVGPVGITKVLTVVLENHGTEAAMTGMPYLASLARAHGRTTHYRALTHPSLPNYLALAGGSTFGVLDDGGPERHPIASASVFDAALARGRNAATYAEGMARPCQRQDAGRYATRHNPWTYFASPASRAACAKHDLPLAALPAAIRTGALPHVGLLVPDLCNDAHDCGLGTADRWLRQWLGAVLAGPDYRSGHLAVVVTFDEDEGHQDVGSDVLTVVVAPALTHRVVDVPLDHVSWCRWMTDLVGAEPAPGARRATSLGSAFGL